MVSKGAGGLTCQYMSVVIALGEWALPIASVKAF